MEASAHRLAAVEQKRDLLLFVDLKGMDWDGYLLSRSSSFRKNLRQRERALRRDHSVEVRTATEETLEGDLALLFRLHALRWEGRKSSLDHRSQRILSTLARSIQRQGWLRLRVLELDGQPAAAFLDWRVGHRYATYQGGFDPRWSRKGVGIVLTAITIRMAIEEGAEVFDFLLGNEPYKRRFGAVARQAPTIVLARAMRPIRLLVSAEAGLRRRGDGLARRRGFRSIASTTRRLLPVGRRL
jgi:CelD/BcsL family acetyltransferase involved in cellulose biosynthesis